MRYVLTVVHPFADYPKGAQITEPQAMRDVLKSENASKVVRVPAP